MTQIFGVREYNDRVRVFRSLDAALRHGGDILTISGEWSEASKDLLNTREKYVVYCPELKMYWTGKTFTKHLIYAKQTLSKPHTYMINRIKNSWWFRRGNQERTLEVKKVKVLITLEE